MHWADGGSSDLQNAALLCEHHHQTVHRRRLAGTLVQPSGDGVVEWDLKGGSYDLLLARRSAIDDAPADTG